MAIASSLRRLLTTDSGLESDAVLLARFAERRDEAAFATLLARHGPMVRAVCRRHCRDPHLAADAEQGVWLVLARRAAAMSRPDRLAGWLFGVAVRIGRKVAAGAIRVGPRPARATAPDVAVGVMAEELLRVLDEELAALPEAERVPLVLCYLEGRTQDEAARACGTCVRTLRRRLDRGREALRRRLERRGVAPAAALGALAVVPCAAPASTDVLAVALADGPAPSSLSPWIAEELAMVRATWWTRVALLAGLGTALVAASVWARDDKPAAGKQTREPQVLTPGAAEVRLPREVERKPPVAAPVAYKDLMLVLVNKDGAAAVIFHDPEKRSVSYKFRYESADGKTTLSGGGKVFERYTDDGKYDGGDLHIEAGPIKIEWSVGDLNRGWIYYHPEKLSVQIAHARDFDDRVETIGDQKTDYPRLDLKRYMQK
ncbi:MAG TPA: RNA polymerase sigma factor [Gemmataceae bacterium]|nr:RNA polymerase sigma factor [Gemmataceae bacterium]